MIELGTAHTRSSAPPEAFFARWLDHATWTEWDSDTEWVRLDGPAKAGTTGRLKPKGGPAVRFTIAVCDPPHEYTDTSRLPGARLTFRHTATVDENGTRLHARATLDGPLAWLWAKVMGAGFRESVPSALSRLVTLVESEADAHPHASADHRPR